MIPFPHATRPLAGAAAALLLLLLSSTSAAAADGSAAATAAGGSKRCQTLPTSMTYSQDKAPRDISAVVSLQSGANLVRCCDFWIVLGKETTRPKIYLLAGQIQYEYVYPHPTLSLAHLICANRT